jgi:hypothetical protein
MRQAPQAARSAPRTHAMQASKAPSNLEPPRIHVQTLQCTAQPRARAAAAPVPVRLWSPPGRPRCAALAAAAAAPGRCVRARAAAGGPHSAAAGPAIGLHWRGSEPGLWHQVRNTLPACGGSPCQLGNPPLVMASLQKPPTPAASWRERLASGGAAGWAASTSVSGAGCFTSSVAAASAGPVFQSSGGAVGTGTHGVSSGSWAGHFADVWGRERPVLSRGLVSTAGRRSRLPHRHWRLIGQELLREAPCNGSCGAGHLLWAAAAPPAGGRRAGAAPLGALPPNSHGSRSNIKSGAAATTALLPSGPGLRHTRTFLRVAGAKRQEARRGRAAAAAAAAALGAATAAASEVGEQDHESPRSGHLDIGGDQ